MTGELWSWPEELLAGGGFLTIIINKVVQKQRLTCQKEMKHEFSRVDHKH